MTTIASQLHNINKLKVRDQKQRKNISTVSPLDAVKKSIRKDIAKSELFCVTALKQKASFSSLNEHQFKSIAQNMTKMTATKGTIIVHQDSLGDRCYIVESGVLKQTRKLIDDSIMDMDDIYKESVFGEMCFFTDELRPTTITVKSDTVELYVLLKSTYSNIIDSTKQVVVEIRDQLAKDVVNKVKIFQKLTTAIRQQVIDAMIPVLFPEGSYICRQGKLGKGFYVITSGKCIVTYNNSDNNGEREVRALEAGDYFGKLLLLLLLFFILII